MEYALTKMLEAGTLKVTFSAIEEIEDLRRNLFGNRDLTDEEGSQLARKIQGCNNQTEALNSVFPNMAWGDFVEILKRAEDQNYMTRLVKMNCRGRRVSPNFPGKDQLRMALIFNSGNQMINRVLESGEPVYLDYHSSVLRDGLNLRQSGYMSGRRRTPHSSLITGRRFNSATNKCEYLIKNSHGTSCLLYAEDLECSNGQIWLPEELLEGSFIRTISFEGP